MTNPAGTDTALEWMLPADTRPRTGGNEVRPLVHGAAYFRRLCEVVGATRAGDRIFFTDWRGDADELLDDDGPRVEELLCTAAKRGVEVRGLLWRSHSDKATFSAQENQQLGRDINDAGGEALLDQRVRRGGSHHQKLFVIRHPDVRATTSPSSVASTSVTAGGTTRGTSVTRSSSRWTRGTAIAAWHDAMVEIRGPAVVRRARDVPRAVERPDAAGPADAATGWRCNGLRRTTPTT